MTLIFGFVVGYLVGAYRQKIKNIVVDSLFDDVVK